MELGLLRRNNGIKIVGDTMELGLLGNNGIKVVGKK